MTRSRHGTLLGALVLAGLITAVPVAHARQAAACQPTLADYRALQRGMSYTESAAQLGCAGHKVSGLSIGRNHRSTYSWRGRGSFGANLNLTFRNGRLTDKSQLGLR